MEIILLEENKKKKRSFTKEIKDPADFEPNFHQIEAINIKGLYL